MPILKPIISPEATPGWSTKGALLALDGRALERPALPMALQLCRRSGQRLDILIVNPPKAATFMLGRFLHDLEVNGIDYRLTSVEGNLGIEVVRYVHRFRHVSMILLDCSENWRGEQGPVLDTLRQEGYRVITLLSQRARPVTLATPIRQPR